MTTQNLTVSARERDTLLAALRYYQYYRMQGHPFDPRKDDLIDTIGFYAIIACLVGLLLSGLILVIGPRIGFDRASTVGKVGIFASLGGAFLIGISATLVNFFYNAGA